MMVKEDQQIEWKTSWRDEYMKWICGFANAEGGRLVVGKDDKGRTVGVSDADRLMQDLPNKIRDLLFRKHPSLPANPDVANAFFRAGMIEAWGDGYERIVEACQAAGNPKPKLRCEADGIWIEFAFPEEYLARVEARGKTPGKTTPRATQEASVKTSVKILRAVGENANVTIPELAEIAGVTTRSVERNIKKLQETGRLKRIGPDRGNVEGRMQNAE